MADWFRFYEDFFDNPRYQYAIHQLPEVCPVTVLILTEHCRHKSDTIRWTGDEIDLLGFSAKIAVPPAKINEAVKLLEKIRYIEIKEGILTFLKWNDLQSEYCRKKASKKAKLCPDTIRTLSGQCPPRGEEIRGDKRRDSQARFAESPSEKEVIAKAQMIGLADWKARDWFNEMQGCGWLDHVHRPISDWAAVLTRVKTKWESDGRPSSPPKPRQSNSSNSNQTQDTRNRNF